MCTLINNKEAAWCRDMKEVEKAAASLSLTETKVVALLSNEDIEGICGGTDVDIAKVNDDDVFRDTPVPGCSSNDTFHDATVLQNGPGHSVEQQRELGVVKPCVC